MPEWLVECGIGETRAAMLKGGEIVEARISLDGVTPAGSILAARLVDIGRNGRNAVACSEDGTQYLLPRGAAGACQGATLTIEVTRELIPGREPWKRPLARVLEAKPAGASPTQRDDLRELRLPSLGDELAAAGWDDLIEQARSGLVAFPGGELRLSVTPAMTVIDVDGYLAPHELALRGASEAARSIRRLDIGGSIGIDLPTVSSRADRHAAGEAIDTILPRPFERTAVNGFGFVQVVRPRSRASLLELASDRPAFEARVLLRRAAFESAGTKTLVANPAVISTIERHSAWVETLSRQLGGIVRLRADPRLPMSGGYAEPS